MDELINSAAFFKEVKTFGQHVDELLERLQKVANDTSWEIIEKNDKWFIVLNEEKRLMITVHYESLTRSKWILEPGSQNYSSIETRWTDGGQETCQNTPWCNVHYRKGREILSLRRERNK